MDTRPGTPPSPLIAPAELTWRGDQPYSTAFGDIYHAADGAAEVGRVFLEPTNFSALCQRAAGEEPVRVGELGFGSGLNFVVAAEQSLQTGRKLHFISFEAAPIAPADFMALAERRSAAHPLYRELGHIYPPLIRGWHRRYLAGGRIMLSLFWGEAAQGLHDIEDRQRHPVDAWFLDGFAPDRNPAMWEDPLFRQIARLSEPGTRVATFTAAGRVRRGLGAAGFQMRRVDQRPHKRESLAGVLAEGGGRSRPANGPRDVLVAGAGLAGASAARHLAEAGVRVRVADPALGRGGPGAPEVPYPPGSRVDVTVLHGRLLADGSAAAALRCHGFLYAASFLRRFPEVRRTGVLQLPAGSGQAARLAAISAAYRPSGPWLQSVDTETAARLTGWPVTAGGLWFADGGVVDTPALCRTLLDHPAISTTAEAVQHPPPEQPLVLACGPACHAFETARYLEIAPVHGQLDLVSVASPPLAPMVGNGYLAPAGGLLAAGATYEYRPWNPEEATRRNLEQLQDHGCSWRRRVRGTRTVSSDRLPVAGHLYAADGSPLPAQLVSTGHGSMGAVTSHLAGAVIAGLITGEFPPLTRELEAALSPLRFRERQARRGFRHGARP